MTNSVKNNIIKKYGKDNILWEIISYHDSEEDAYDTEEFLISSYGVMAEGGILTNVAKNRYDYPEKVSGYIARGGISLPKKYSEDQIVKAYKYHFSDRLSNREIHRLTGINIDYMSYLWSGKKCKDLYEKYITSGKITKSNKKIIRSDTKYTDTEVFDILKLYYLDNVPTEVISEKYGVPLNYLRGCAKGRKRYDVYKDFFHKYPFAKRETTPRIDIDSNKEYIDYLLCSRISIPAICKLTNIPKTTLYRHYIPKGYVFENKPSPKKFYVQKGVYLTKKPSEACLELPFNDKCIIFTTYPSDIRRFS